MWEPAGQFLQLGHHWFQSVWPSHAVAQTWPQRWEMQSGAATESSQKRTPFDIR